MLNTKTRDQLIQSFLENNTLTIRKKSLIKAITVKINSGKKIYNKTFEQIKKVQLFYAGLKDKNAFEIFEALKENRFSEIIAPFNKLSKIFLKKLFSTYDTQQLQVLSLEYNNIQNFNSLIKFLKQNNSLQHLDISGNTFSSVEQFKNFILVINTHHAIKNLSLTDMELHDAHGECLAQHISNPISLQSLDIQANDLIKSTINLLDLKLNELLFDENLIELLSNYNLSSLIDEANSMQIEASSEAIRNSEELLRLEQTLKRTKISHLTIHTLVDDNPTMPEDKIKALLQEFLNKVFSYNTHTLSISIKSEGFEWLFTNQQISELQNIKFINILKSIIQPNNTSSNLEIANTIHELLQGKFKHLKEDLIQKLFNDNQDLPETTKLKDTLKNLKKDYFTILYKKHLAKIAVLNTAHLIAEFLNIEDYPDFCQLLIEKDHAALMGEIYKQQAEIADKFFDF